MKIIEKKKKTQAVVMIVVGFVILAVSAMPRTYKTTTTRSATCKVCHREFTDSDDVESIKHTNMCSNCYYVFKLP